MPLEEAGLDIDYDQELAQIQGAVAGVAPVPDFTDSSDPVSGEIVTAQRTVEFMGERFRIADKIGLMPLLKFAAFADVTTSDPRALGAMYAMLRDCIYPGEPGCGECGHCAPPRCGECQACERASGIDDESAWPDCLVNAPDEMACADYDPGDWLKFENHAMETRADADDLLDVISKVMEMVAGRPTQPPAVSSPGQRSTSRGSTGRSSGRRGRGSRR